MTFQPMPGMVDTPHEVYLFDGAEHIGAPQEREEAGQVAWWPLAEVPAMVHRGELAGAGSLVGLLYLLGSRAVER